MSKYQDIVIALGIAVLSIAFIFSVHNTSLVQSWDYQIKDFIETHSTREPSSDIVIIAIDQNSLTYIKNKYNLLWPWPRSLYGRITEYLNHCNADAIIYDILFTHPDIPRLNQDAGISDSIFASSLEKAGNAALALQLEDSSHNANNTVLEQLQKVEYNIPEAFIQDYPEATLPLSKFQEAARISGSVNFTTDEDGIARRTPLFYRYQDQIFPFLSLAGLICSENIDQIDYDSTQNKIIADKHHFDINNKGYLNVRWYGPGGVNNTFSYLSFANLLDSYRQWKIGKEPNIKPEELEDKTVFLGATAAGLWDVKPTPFSTRKNPFPGVEIYSTVYSNMVQDTVVNTIDYWTLSPFILLFLFLFNFSWRKYGISRNGLFTFIALLIPAVLGYTLFHFFSYHIPVLEIELSLLLSLVIIVSYNYWTEDKQKRLIKNVFQHYMHPNVVEKLTKNYEEIELGGEKSKGTVLFTDIQNFTGIAENLDADKTVQMLNNYFENIEHIIFENGGMVDKYLGDGLMAIFGPPLNNPEQTNNCSQCILDLQENVPTDYQLGAETISLNTRIGVATGEILVGNLGSSNRMDYTAIGDIVNLASRLEDVNKIYGTKNIISEATYIEIKDKFTCREIDEITVKGRDKPVRIYNVICRTEKMTANTELLLELHSEALNFYQKGNFKKSRKSFKKLKQNFPEDKVSDYYLNKCQEKLRQR